MQEILETFSKKKNCKSSFLYEHHFHILTSTRNARHSFICIIYLETMKLPNVLSHEEHTQKQT